MIPRVHCARRSWLTGLLRIITVVVLIDRFVDPAAAAAPVLLRTPGYEAPVHGGPGDLLLLAGSGFQPTDRVVYRAADATDRVAGHPRAVPVRGTASEGSASVVKVGSPPYALTIRLPATLEPNRPYHLWVVTAAGEWSQSVSINDARPSWFTPDYAFSTVDFAGLGRSLRIVGRNLRASAARPMRIRLQGRQTYVMTSQAPMPDDAAQDYVSEGVLPSRLEPGLYSVAISRDGHTWTPVSTQRLEVRPDPTGTPRFDVADPSFGGCHPNDGADDSECFRQAFAAARLAGGGTVFLPAGSWDINARQLRGEEQQNGFILARNVNFQGAGPKLSSVIRHDAKVGRPPGALLTLTGANSVLGISFSDDARYESLQQSRAMIQLGIRLAGAASQHSAAADQVSDIVISSDEFHHVGRAITDSSLPIRHLFVTRNEFGGYDNGLLLTGSGADPAHPYRIDDSVVRWNSFIPGSYLDISARQGSVATQLGASNRLDFSGNTADGTRTESLQDATDPPGWRAAFFWNLNNNQEQLLIAQNRISCPGDKAGDGEAIALDGNGTTFGFDVAPAVEAAGQSWIRVRGRLLHEQFGHPVPADYYRGHWVFITEGPGIGQARKVDSYSEDPAAGTVTLHVSPDWDVPPGKGRIALARQYWQAYIVANDINQASPPCRKSNLTDARGGLIGFWTPASDSTIEGNRQTDSDGIEYGQGYTAHTPSCPTCVGGESFLTGIEIRGNLIEGEYDWSSDCSWSGIRGYFIATATPEAPPPVLGFGVVIAHNTISRADGQRGGAIDIAHSGPPGPPPGTWPLVQNPLIFGNRIRDIDGPLPRPQCRQNQKTRAGIRLEGPDNIHDAVLADNRCERVSIHLEDAGVGTVRLCSAQDSDSCECSSR
jgi:hypothetical protein